MLASANITHITLSIDLFLNGQVISTIDDNTFSVNSKHYDGYIGFILNDNISSSPVDKIRFNITASGSDYGTYCGNFKSYIKVCAPIDTLNKAVLSEREKAIGWYVSNSKWSYPTVMVLDFIAQLDYCLLNGKNGQIII